MTDKVDRKNFTGPHQFSQLRMEGWISCAPFERLLQMDIVEASDGKSVLTMPFLIYLAQGAGLMHGGALVSLADTAVAMAIKSMVPQKSHFATIALEAKYIAPVRKGVVTAKAEIFSRQGRTWKGKAVVYDEDGRPVMEFMSTFKMARDMEMKSGVEFQEKGS